MKKRVLIIGEGFEEKPYLDKLLSFPIFGADCHYSFAPVINVKGNGNIFARYQFEMQRGFNDAVLIFCDADKGSEQFLQIRDKIGEMYFENKEDAMLVFMFVNPVTLQVVLSHFGDVKITKVSKKKNAEIVEQLTGIKDYDAKDDQIAEMIGKIFYRSYEEMKKKVSNISTSFNDLPSTNFLLFLERFEGDDDSWIDQINNAMKKE